MRLSRLFEETVFLRPFSRGFVGSWRHENLLGPPNLPAHHRPSMRQRENALSVGMKSALRNPRTPGTAGRASGLKWSDNLEVRPRSDLAESRMPNAGEPNVSRRMSLGISPPPVPFPTRR